MSLFLIALVHSLLFQFAYSQTCSPENGVKLTFYGFPDGGDTTSFGCSGTSPSGQGNNGGTAGGSGTYSDPETFATAMDNTDFKECEIVYIPYFQKYFRYNDHCQQCNTDFHSGLIHLDLWIGPDSNGGQAEILCEETFGSVSGQTIIRSPPATLPVNSGALWDGSTCYNDPSNGRVFPNPNTSGLCSGGSSSSGGGSPAPSPSPSPSTANNPPSQPPPQPQPKKAEQPAPVSSSPAASVVPPSHPIKAAIVQAPPASSSPAAAVVPQQEKAAAPLPPTPTTLYTTILTKAANPTSSPVSTGKFGSPGMTYAQAMQASYQGCASWNACIGDPCQSYNDCAGEWICVAGRCTDNLHD